jgi:hypothetical protein
MNPNRDDINFRKDDRMKKSLSLLVLLLAACLLLSACGVVYDPTNITVRSKNQNPNTEFQLSADEIETLVSIWNNANWEPDITKTGYDYVFEFSETELRYSSEVGIFNDPDNNRHLELTEEERIWINSFLE